MPKVSIIMPTNLQTLSQSLEHWQALYIISITLAVISTAGIILFNFHIKGREHGTRWSNYLYIVASALALVATIAIITKTRSIDAEKDRRLKQFEAQANIQIQQFKAVAAQAVQKAEEAKLENSALRVVVSNSDLAAKKAEAELAAENEKTNQFTHALELQQENMAQQIHVSPVLNASQIQAMGDSLTAFAGQDVIIHLTADTTVGRLAYGIEKSLEIARIKHTQSSIDMGALYQGVSVVVHAAQGHPALADALVNAPRSAGIVVNTVALPSVPENRVAIYLGPS